MFEHNETLNEARERNIRDALAEDLGHGDWSARLIPDGRRARARVSAEQAAVVCGRDWFDGCILALDRRASIRWQLPEGTQAEAGCPVCELEGNARALFSAKRSALNFLQVLSATATATRRHVEAVDAAATNPRGCAVFDTRETVPGLRQAQKYAVRTGGGHHQRLALWDGIVLREAHIAAAGGIGVAWQQACALRAGVDIQIEVRSFEQLEEALRAGATSIRLEGFTPDGLREAVWIVSGRALLEAPGDGGGLETARVIAATGVDRIALSSLTHGEPPVTYAIQLES